MPKKSAKPKKTHQPGVKLSQLGPDRLRTFAEEWFRAVDSSRGTLAVFPSIRSFSAKTGKTVFALDTATFWQRKASSPNQFSPLPSLDKAFRVYMQVDPSVVRSPEEVAEIARAWFYSSETGAPLAVWSNERAFKTTAPLGTVAFSVASRRFWSLPPFAGFEPLRAYIRRPDLDRAFTAYLRTV